MEWAKPGVVLRPRLAQPYVSLDHLDDVGLLLDGLGKVGHAIVCLEDKAGQQEAVCNTQNAVQTCGLPFASLHVNRSCFFCGLELL